jgi:FkbM family methyltransferase
MTSIDTFSKNKVYYSQNKEDLLLEAFFPDLKNGFYVDVGAYDPDHDSVTKLFYKKGWRGINIEPQPDRYEDFVKARPRDININCGVSNVNGELTLRVYQNGGLSTFSTKLKKENSKNKDPQLDSFKDIKVTVTTLKDIFQKHKVNKINFLKIDVEGLEFEVIKGNDWNKYRPEVICIEADNIQKDWKFFLLDKEYEHVFFDGLNDYYVDAHSDKVGVFDYVKQMIEKRGEWIRYSDYCTFLGIQNDSDQMQNDINSLRASEKEKDKLIIHLKSVLDSPSILFRRFVKVVLKRIIEIIMSIFSNK